MTSDKELMGASTTLLVLSCLNAGPSYGYELLKRLNFEAAQLFSWQEGTLYPVLHRLEREDLVRASWQQTETGRRRKYYTITAKGRRHLHAATEQWHAWHALVSRVTRNASEPPTPALA
jgi:PadR family transcriptional regulator, regulatory protein PadR